MAQISAGLVKELRELTGLGMMECKKALAEAGGDLKKAEALLRIRSGAKASKAAGRVAAEGVIGAWLSPDGKLGALVEVNCETDFVAKNEDFVAFARELAEAVAKSNPADVAGLSGFEARRQSLVQKIGENIGILRFARLQAQGRLALYVHGARIGARISPCMSRHSSRGIRQSRTCLPTRSRANATSPRPGPRNRASRRRSWRR